MRFSIIIPVYNTERYLRKCLDSLCNQRYKNFEVILVDDGSKDSSGRICDEYAEKYRFITVVHKDNSGVIEARNIGIKIAKGDYIGFLDSDDWVKAEYLLTIEQAIQEHHPEIVCFESEKVIEDTIVSMSIPFSGFYNKEQMRNKIYPIMLYNPQKPFYTFGIIPAMWSKFFKRNLLEKLPQIDNRIFWGEDGVFTYSLFLEAESSCFINESLYCWRYRTGSACHSYKSKMYENIRLLCDAFYEMRTIYPEISDSLNYYIVFIYLVLMLNEVKSKDRIFFRIKSICADRTLTNALERIDWKKVNSMYKALFYMVKYKCIFLLTCSVKIVQCLKER